MITGYELLKYVHVLMAIVAVGFNASYAIWLRRAAPVLALPKRCLGGRPMPIVLGFL